MRKHNGKQLYGIQKILTTLKEERLPEFYKKMGFPASKKRP